MTATGEHSFVGGGVGAVQENEALWKVGQRDAAACHFYSPFTYSQGGRALSLTHTPDPVIQGREDETDLQAHQTRHWQQSSRHGINGRSPKGPVGEGDGLVASSRRHPAPWEVYVCLSRRGSPAPRAGEAEVAPSKLLPAMQCATLKGMGSLFIPQGGETLALAALPRPGLVSWLICCQMPSVVAMGSLEQTVPLG